MNRGVFVTATDTGVGKTVVTAGVVRWLRARGMDVVPMKPVQTGAESREGRLAAPDLEFSLAAAGLRPDDGERRLMAPFLYEPACSPHLAGRLAGRCPDIDSILECAGSLLRRRRALVVEGAGGVLAPLNERQLTIDLLQALGFAAVLVSRIGLGAINHALLSIEAIRARGISLLGIVFNRTAPSPPQDSYIEEDNPLAIAHFGKTRVLGRIPYLGEARWDRSETWRSFEEAAPGLEEIARHLEAGHG